MSVTYTIQNGVAVITIDNPPVNALSPEVAAALELAINLAAVDEVNALVITGAGRTFVAGVDIAVLQNIAWDEGLSLPSLHGLLEKVENSAKPVVMAIHGTALGGGLELAMAGHYRLAVAAAQLGQPEVNLGLIPGAEGTQRLPRLVGLEKAIEMCVGGKPISASEALRCGLVDKVVDGDLITQALEFASDAKLPRRTSEHTDKLGNSEQNAEIFTAGLALAAKLRPNQEAPKRAVESIQAATTLPFAEGCRRESELFHNCLRSEQAKALLYAFFAERAAAKVPGIGKSGASIRQVAIVGAGTMGRGITMACANAGISVLLKDATAEALEAGFAAIRRNYQTSVDRGRFTHHEVAQRLSLIKTQLDYTGFGSADLIIEAIFENLALKKRLFAELDQIAGPDCILASNTSILSIDEMASATWRAGSVIGLHFFSPANVMRLLEIVRGKETTSQTIERALAFARQLKKVGVVAGNCPGFIGNRMFFPYLYEAQFLVEDGATPEQVDRALKGFGMAMGPFAVDDLAGIDVACRIRQEMPDLDRALFRKPLVQDQLYAMGRYGQKTEKGWYAYGKDRQPLPDPLVEELIRRSAEKAGIKPRTIDDSEIVERCVYALINEGARLLEQGFALRASDIDVVYLNGYGFPNWRGGPMFYADLNGLKTIVSRLQTFHKELGPRWSPAPLLERLAAEDRRFRDYNQRSA